MTHVMSMTDSLISYDWWSVRHSSVSYRFGLREGFDKWSTSHQNKFQAATKAKKDETPKEDKKNRILDFNMRELEKDEKPNELKVVFQGAEQEKIKAIKQGKKTLGQAYLVVFPVLMITK